MAASTSVVSQCRAPCAEALPRSQVSRSLSAPGDSATDRHALPVVLTDSFLLTDGSPKSTGLHNHICRVGDFNSQWWGDSHANPEEPVLTLEPVRLVLGSLALWRPQSHR